jgi:uncharacterized membrane protein YbhN (UPF0104 family)
MPVNVRRILRTTGLLLSAAALVWIALRFSQSGALELLEHAPVAPFKLVASLFFLALAYAGAAVLLAFAWWRLTSALASGTHTSVASTMATYAVSQYGKYLPGNIAHYAIRHAWSRRYGVSHATLGLASILEAALLLLSALALTLLADTHSLRALSVLDPRVAIVLLAVILAALGLVLHKSRSSRLLGRFLLPPLPPMSVLVLCLALYCGFFALAAGLLDALAHVLGIDIGSFAMLLAASAASWLAGFIVIGAPGGLGVREAAFVALAGGALGESHALLLIGVFRVVTFLGDTLFFAAGALVLRMHERVTDETIPASKNRRSP